jgi:putative endopeptidase
MTTSKTSSYALDTSVRPQDDFYGYVNNSWLAAHPVPDSETRWGTFDVLRDEAWQNMRAIYEQLQAQDHPAGSVQQQAKDFYYTGMHMDDLADNHMHAVRSLFADIDAISSSKQLPVIIGELHAMGLSGPWSSVVDADNQDSSQHVIRFYQSGLTLPDRDYYMDDTAKMRDIRAHYKTHVKKVFKYFPELAADSSQAWDAIWTFEHELAKISRSSTDLRDVEANYNRVTFADMASTYPRIDWPAYAGALGWTAGPNISIDQPEFFKLIDNLIGSKSLSDWKTYLKWRVVIACYSKINSEISQLRFEFFGKVLGGSTELLPLWKRVAFATDHAIGDATGQLYAERHFPESSKQQVLDIVESTRAAYADRIKNLDWMSDKTKAYAQKKLANIKVLIGYPDQWRDYSTLPIGRDSYLGNALAAASFEKSFWLAKLRQPTSREDWFMYPQTVNAYHDPNRLVICFPAAILQPPFFDPQAHVAANFGGIGAVIGHELTHGFDDQGCMFDASGNVRTWQTDAERKTFKKKAKVIIDQADHFQVLPGLTLKGGLIIGESIADLGGILVAFCALRSLMGDKLTQPAQDGLTHEQLFYVNFARTECANIREEKLREYTLSDPHPASVFRVNGMVCHDDDFYRVFNVTKGDDLYRPPARRAKIW